MADHISFQPTIVYAGLVEFNGLFDWTHTATSDTYFDFSYMQRSIESEMSLLFDPQLPNGLVSDLDILFKSSLVDYLEDNFGGKHIKRVGLDLINSGYPDDTAPNICFYFREEAGYTPVNMKRVGTYDYMSFNFTEDQESILFKSRDFSKWKSAPGLPLLAYGFYGTFIINKISFKFVDTIGVISKFWSGTVNCAENVNEVIVGETEIVPPAVYDFVGNVLAAGQIEFGNDVGENYFQNVSGGGFSTFPSIVLGTTPVFRCYDTDYFSGLNNQALAMEAGPFCLEMNLSLESATERTEIIGNTYGLDYGMGGFTIYHMNRQFYFARRTESPMGGFVKTGYTGFVFSSGVFKTIEISVDENNIFRFFLDGVNKKTEAGCFDVPYQNDGVFLGRAGRYNKTWSPFYVAGMRFSKGTAMIHREDYTPDPLPY
jgi:hypothetical protein